MKKTIFNPNCGNKKAYMKPSLKLILTTTREGLLFTSGKTVKLDVENDEWPVDPETSEVLAPW